jgi:RND family efflux transporter MFP subunit
MRLELLKLIPWFVWLGCLNLTGCRESDDQPGAGEIVQPPIPVITTLVSREIVHRPVVCAGIVHPLRREELSFLYSGPIAAINVAEGARVQQGDTLGSLDSTALTRSWVQWGLELIVERQKFERMQERYERTEIREKGFDEQEKIVASLKNIYFNTKGARVSRYLTAPFTGRIFELNASPGDTATPGEPVILLVDMDPFAMARSGLSEEDYYQVEAGDSAVVVPLDTLELPLAGVVRSRGLSRELSDLPFSVDILFENPGGIVSMGMRVAVTIRSQQRERTILIPQDALVGRSERSASVFLTDRTARFAVRRHVDLGAEVGFNIIIEKGLLGGERLIIHGQDRLKHGSPIVLLTGTLKPRRQDLTPGEN